MKNRILILAVAIILALAAVATPQLSEYECQNYYENCAVNCWWWDQECLWNCNAGKWSCLTGQDCFYDQQGYIYCLDRH